MKKSKLKGFRLLLLNYLLISELLQETRFKDPKSANLTLKLLSGSRLICKTIPEVEFLEEIQTEVLRVFLLAIHRHLYYRIVLPSFSFLGLEISTATARGCGDVWVNKYLDQ
jgi:hypothetical protein